MKSLMLIALLLAMQLPLAQADTPNAHPLPDSVKTARTKALDFGQINRVRTIAKLMLDAKIKQAADNPLAPLAGELDFLRKSLSALGSANRSKGEVPLQSGSEQSVPAARKSQRDTQIGGIADRLLSKRIALQGDARDDTRVTEALKKSEELETELNEIAGLSDEAKAQRLQELSFRLTPRRTSEFASSGKVQPTLMIGYPVKDGE